MKKSHSCDVLHFFIVLCPKIDVKGCRSLVIHVRDIVSAPPSSPPLQPTLNVADLKKFPGNKNDV